MSGVRPLVAVLLTVSTALTSCHLVDSPEAIERWSGPVSDLRFDWDAEPGIDVLTGAAVRVRAYIESTLLAQYMGKLDYAYPGFTHAVAPNAPKDSPDIGARNRIPSLDHPLSNPLIGNDRYRILSLNRDGRNVTATVCNYSYAVAAPHSNNSFTSVATGIGEGRGIYALRVTLVAPIDESDHLPSQSGPEPAPSVDVFGDWQVTGFLNFFLSQLPNFKSQWPTYEADVETCIKKAPDPPERRAFLIDGEHSRSDFPTSPPKPGWPTT